MIVSAIQMDITAGDVEQNHETAARLMHTASEEGAEVIVLPELWNTGYVWLQDESYRGERDIRRLAQSVPGGFTAEFLSRQSSELGAWIVGGTIARCEGGDVYNTCAVFAPDGSLVHCYDKAHLIGLMKEPDHLTAGDSSEPFQLDDVTCGAIICYDLRFPELARRLAVRGARIIFAPAQWPAARIDHWQTLLRARAIENQCFVVGCNRLGSSGDDVFVGRSMIIGPMGQTLGCGDEECNVLTVRLDLSQVEEARELLACFSDRREDVYGR